jgi:hypothetical protein
MNIGDYLEMLVQAYNPNKYVKLTEQKAREHISFLVITVILALAVFTAIMVPFTLRYAKSIPDRTKDIEQFQLDAHVNATRAVTLTDHPEVVLDLDANSSRTGTFTLTRSNILYPKYLFFGTGSMPWNDVRNLKQASAARDTMIASMVIFLLPSIIFWVFATGLFLCIILFVLLLLYGHFVPKLFRHRLTVAENWRLATITMPSVLIFSLALYPLGAIALVWGGLILTIVMFSIGVAVLSEMNVAERKHK